jgi:hypothetical protein
MTEPTDDFARALLGVAADDIASLGYRLAGLNTALDATQQVPYLRDEPRKPIPQPLFLEWTAANQLIAAAVSQLADEVSLTLAAMQQAQVRLRTLTADG